MSPPPTTNVELEPEHGTLRTNMEQTITVSQRGEERIQNGHFWVYRGDIGGGRAEPGAIVRVAAPNGRFLARAFYSDQSQITLRILTRHDVAVDRAFWRAQRSARAAPRRARAERRGDSRGDSRAGAGS